MKEESIVKNFINYTLEMMKNESGNILNNVTGNLFFIHTPFQLFVAQQLIHDQKLEINALVLFIIIIIQPLKIKA